MGTTDNTQMFIEIMDDIGFSVFKTADYATGDAPLRSLVAQEIESLFKYRPTEDEIQRQINSYETFDNFVNENPHIVFDEQKKSIHSFCNINDASTIIDALGVYAEDWCTEYLFEKLESHKITPELSGERLDKWSSFADIVEYGETVLKNGNEKEQQFYKDYKREFEVLDFVNKGCPDVDLEQVFAHFSPKQEKEQEVIER